MAQDFIINSTTITGVNDAQWREQAEGDLFNGKIAKNRWRELQLRATVVTAAQFDTLYALKGTKCSVTVAPYDNRTSDYQAYYGADFLTIQGEHNGPVVENVRIELRVRL